MINIISPKHYEIDMTQLKNGESVLCPFDKDMVIYKTADGKTNIIKKRFISKDTFKTQN